MTDKSIPRDSGKKLVNPVSAESPLLSNVPSKPYPELPEVLSKFVDGVRKELGTNLVGVYLVGSLAIGDFDLDSDIDFLVVTEKEITNKNVGSLQVLHSRIYNIGCYPAEHLEGSYIDRETLNSDETVDVKSLWYLDNGSTTLERSLHDNKWHVRWVLREKGIGIIGPDPALLLDPVPVESMLAEVKSMLHLVADLFAADLDKPLTFWNSRFGQSYAVLTCCRMLHTLRTGSVQSKYAGMKWALRTLDPMWSTLIHDAWEERKGVRYCIKIRQRADTALLTETNKFITYTLREAR